MGHPTCGNLVVAGKTWWLTKYVGVVDTAGCLKYRDDATLARKQNADEETSDFHSRIRVTSFFCVSDDYSNVIRTFFHPRNLKFVVGYLWDTSVDTL